MEVRTYNPESDYEGVYALLKDGSTFGGQFDEARDMADRLTIKPDSILVAEENGEIVGTVTLFEDGRIAWLYRFAVSEKHEEEVSKMLFEEAKERFNVLGHTQVLVYAPTDVDKFKKRYTKLGFATGSDYTAFWQDI